MVSPPGLAVSRQNDRDLGSFGPWSVSLLSSPGGSPGRSGADRNGQTGSRWCPHRVWPFRARTIAISAPSDPGACPCYRRLVDPLVVAALTEMAKRDLDGVPTGFGRFAPERSRSRLLRTLERVPVIVAWW